MGRPSWLPPDPVEARVRAMGPIWAQMAEERKERERVEVERLRELWEGVNVGDVMGLTEGEHLRRGGLLLVDERTGEVKVKRVRLIGIEGEFGVVEDCVRWGVGEVKVVERVKRERLQVLEEEEVKEEVRGDAPVVYWDEGESVEAAAVLLRQQVKTI